MAVKDLTPKNGAFGHTILLEEKKDLDKLITNILEQKNAFSGKAPEKYPCISVWTFERIQTATCTLTGHVWPGHLSWHITYIYEEGFNVFQESLRKKKGNVCQFIERHFVSYALKLVGRTQ